MSEQYNVWHKDKASLPPIHHWLIAQDTGYGRTKRYMACDSFEYMCGRLSDISNGYEVIDSLATPVWLFCDYDGEDGKIKFTDIEVRNALSSLVLSVLYDVYKISRATEYFSTATTSSKTSIHMKMDVLFADMHGLKQFMLKVQEKALTDNIPEFIPEDPKRVCLIDASVYTNFRLYRCLGMSKYGKNNKLVCMDGHDQEHHFVKYYQDSIVKFDSVIPKVGRPDARPGKRNATFINEEPAVCGSYHDMLEKYADYINSFDCIVDELGAKVAVSKLTSMGEHITCCSIKKDYFHKCPIAGRCHDSNNLYALVNTSKKTITVRCHDEECVGKEGIVARECDYTDTYDRGDVTTMHSQEENIQWSEHYELDGEMRDYPLRPLVCVRAGMGAGKTQALKRLASKFDSSTKALIVTHSRALASRLHSEFEQYGFVHYDQVEGEIVDAKIVVCLDSVWRIRTSAFSFVFLDEAISLFLHFNSPLMGNKTSINLTVLEYTIIQAKYAYFLDACMDHTFGKSIVDYFAVQKLCTPYWIRNTYVRPTNRKVILDVVPMQGSNIVSKSSQFSRACEKVVTLLMGGQNVVVCSSSKSFTVRLQYFINEARPGTSMIVYNSDSQHSLDNVGEYWKTCQLLVYSPTITAGVSFEESHFDSLVAFVSNSHFAPTVDTTLQQLFRVRQLRRGNMYLFVHEFDVDDTCEDAIAYPETREEIVKFLQSDIGLANKYFSTHKVNVPSVYRPSKDRVLEYDVERLSFLVIVGILMMRNRSTLHFSSLLIDTLHFDYGIPCEKETHKGQVSQLVLDHLKAVPSKVPDVPFALVKKAMETIDRSEANLSKRVLHATKNMLIFMRFRWKVPDLDESKHAGFYATVSATTALDSYHKAVRFLAMCQSTVDENKTEMARCIYNTLDNIDPNVAVFKRRMHGHHMKIILGQQFAEALLKDDKETLSRHEEVRVDEDTIMETYKIMIGAMTSSEASYFKTLFEIKNPTGRMLAKWILGGAFGIATKRVAAKHGRENYDVISLKETYLKGMQDKFGVDLMKKTTCMIKR